MNHYKPSLANLENTDEAQSEENNPCQEENQQHN